MNDLEIDRIIAEARTRVAIERSFMHGNPQVMGTDLVERLLDALESLRTERDALAAQIAAAKSWADRDLERAQSKYGEYAEGVLNAQALVRSILSADSDAILRERDQRISAEVIDWIEAKSSNRGYVVGGDIKQAREHFGIGASDE